MTVDRNVALGALLALLLLALFALSLAVGASTGSLDQGDRDRMDILRSGLRGLPGLGTDLEPDDLDDGRADTSCFDRAEATFTAAELTACSFAAPAGIDQVRLGLVEGRCRAMVTGQPGVFDTRSDSTDWDQGRENLTLAGDGATVTITNLDLTGSEPCVVVLNP